MSQRPFLLALVATLTACATTGPKPTGPEVKKLKIVGAKQVSASEVESKILTTENSLLSFLPWIDKEHFDPSAWQADLRRVERFYQAKGYYQAKVIGDEVKEAGKNGVSLVMKVSEGEPTKIDSLEIEGLDELPPEHREKTLDEFPLKKGDIFAEEHWAGVKDLVQGRLRELGYAEATADGEVQVDVATRKASITLTITPGQRYKFGNLFAATDPKPVVPPKRIIEQAEGAITKGDWFSESALAEAQARIFAMGVFGGVKVNRGAPDRESATVPIVIDVRESKFHTIRGGPGIGIDAYSNSVRLTAEYTDRNFFGGLRRMTVGGKFGYAVIPAIWTTITNKGFIGSLRGELEQPRFIFRDVRGQVAIEGESGVEPAYSFLAARGKMGLTYQPVSTFAVTTSYAVEAYLLTNGDVAADLNVGTLGFGCRAQQSGNDCVVTLSYLEQVAEWDRRNDRNDPRQGTYASLALQEGGGPLGGSFKYVRLLADIRGYASFLEDNRLTFSAKLRFGTLLSGSESPIVSRFFSGGSFMRGFNARRLSPMYWIPRVYYTGPESTTQGRDTADLAAANAGTAASGNTVPVGGNGLFEGSVEARYAFPNDIMVASFLDVGMVSEQALPNLADNYYAIGLGLRYLTGIGPIRVDFAYRLPFGPALPLTFQRNPVVNAPGRNPEFAQEQRYWDNSRSCFGIGGSVRTSTDPRG
ncbi:MAG: BamA/OMP85 family outer membrane protein, partial [Myxococcaceae bacterium]